MPASQATRIACIGELLWDLLPDGAKLGGATANFAVFCARLGNRAELISSAGDDELGRRAIELLQQPGLNLDNVQVAAGHPTGTVAVKFTAENQPSYSICEGVAWDFISLTSGVLDSAAAADSIYYGTLAQRNRVSRSTIRSFIEATPSACVRVCDVNLRMPYCAPETLEWSLAHATIAKVSDEELATLFFLLGFSGSVEPRRAADALLKGFPNAKLVAITLGAKGSLLATRESRASHPGFPIALVDTVGAGDAFTAGLTHAYLRGAPLPEVARIGNLCGSFVASRQGASPHLTQELIDEIAAALGIGESSSGHGMALKE